MFIIILFVCLVVCFTLFFLILAEVLFLFSSRVSSVVHTMCVCGARWHISGLPNDVHVLQFIHDSLLLFFIFIFHMWEMYLCSSGSISMPPARTSRRGRYAETISPRKWKKRVYFLGGRGFPLSFRLTVLELCRSVAGRTRKAERLFYDLGWMTASLW